mgnify:CR=1 FL=1
MVLFLMPIVTFLTSLSLEISFSNHACLIKGQHTASTIDHSNTANRLIVVLCSVAFFITDSGHIIKRFVHSLIVSNVFQGSRGC